MFNKFSPGDLVEDGEDLFVVAYPSFNPREELGATARLWAEKGGEKNSAAALITFNAELDRLRGGGYYAPLFFPELAALSRDFVPQFDAAFYLRNFKSGRTPG